MTNPNAMTREFMIAHLRCARARALLAVSEIDVIGVALKSELIDCDQALVLANDAELLRFLLPPADADQAGAM